MKKHISLLAVFSVIAMLFTSCLKDEPITNYNEIQPIVIIPNANWPKNTATGATSVTFAGNTAYEVLLYARISWENTLPKEVVVTFVKDEAAITAYNAKFGTTYIAVPDNAISAGNLKATIAAGTNDASIPVKVNLSLLDATKKYILPYSISDASGENIGTNYKTYLLPLTNK